MNSRLAHDAAASGDGDAGRRRLSLTAFLLRPRTPPLAILGRTFSSLAATFAWRNGVLVALGPEAADGIRDDDTIVLVTLSKDVGAPGWQHFIEDSFGLAGFSTPVGRSMGAMVLCAVTDPADGTRRWVVWTFGSGSRALRKGVIDPRFGLLVALNRIVGDVGEEELTTGRLRQFHYQQFGAYRFDQHTDLLAGAGGPRADEDGYVYGSRQIRIREDLRGPEDLLRLAEEAIDDYRRGAYESAFSFIDDYVLVDDDVTIAKLRTELFADVVVGNDNVDAFVPDDLVDVEDERAIHYVLFPREQAWNASRINLTLGGISLMVRDADESALDWTLRFCDADKTVVAEATILECLSGDITLGDDRYLASDGSFFLVRKEFIELVDDEISQLERTTLELPCYQGRTEREWNESVVRAKPDDFVLVDGTFVRLPGETPFEPADLIHVSGTLVHAKRKGRSSALSYLFTQARQSCQLLSQASEACVQLREIAADAAGSSDLRDRLVEALKALDARPADLGIVLAILGDWRDRDLVNVPFLAKLELIEGVRDIALYGFKPAVALVDLCR
jgi:uncharacterized protein (TIGR04141 family)